MGCPNKIQINNEYLAMCITMDGETVETVSDFIQRIYYLKAKLLNIQI